MKIRITLLLVFLAFIGKAQAQPPNNTCGTAQPLTVGVGACNSILYTNVAATTIGNPPTPACWLPNNMSNTVWFSFAATKPDIEISTNFAGTLADTQVAVYSGTCGSLTMIGCQEDINTASNLLHTDIILHGLTIGNTYYIIVDGKGNATGTFGVCIQESIPVGPALAIQDCTGAESLCGLGNIVVPDGPGGIGFSQEDPSCFGAPGERSSSWYSFTAATNGSLCFKITPNNPIDYDFAVYNTTTSCPGTELVCNWEPESGTGVTGLGCGGVQCETCLAVTAGQTYTILVDRFTANSADGFTLNFAGTTTTFASPNPTFTATSPCIGTATQFTNTTNGNFTYSWNFGDGFTSNLENPTHTFAASGPHSVTLLVTAVPGGCQNSVTKLVTVNPFPIVDAGAGTTVCAGNCYTLGGSTNATGYVRISNFSNNASFAIPDGSAVGASSPITVSGILPATIGASSIASVCINLTHTWDSDLDIFLKCPDGTLMELSTDNGSLDDNYTNTCFTPTAATSITTSTGPFTGTFAPEQSFNILNGCSANGTWQLFVQDDLTGDTGNINSWTITFNNNIPAFTWSPTTAMTNANTLTPTVCPTATTTYTLTGNGAGGCIITDQVTVTVGSGVTAGISYAAPSFCMSDTPKSAALTGTGTFTGGTYSSTTGLTINAVTGQITPATSTAGPYVVTYTIPASGSCGPVSTTTNVQIYAAPNAGADGSATVCETSGAISLAVLITGEQTGGTWTRSSGIGGIFSAAAGTYTPTLGASPINTFTYLATGAGVCGNDSSLVTITLNPVIPPLLSCGTATTNSVQFNWTALPGATGYNVSYQVNANPIVPIGPIGNVLTYSVNTLNPGDSVTITVTPTGGAGACFAPGSLSCLTSNCVLPTATISYAGTPFCTSLITPQTVTLTGTGAYTGGTYSSTTGLSINAVTGAIAPGTSTAGNYTVTYTIPASAGCAAVTATASVTITALPTAIISYVGTPFCTSISTPQAVTLTGTGAYTGGTYSSTTGLSINAVTGAIAPGTSTAGNYTVTYTIPASAGCAAVTATASVTITALPTAIISYVGTPFCTSISTPQAVTLTGTGAYTGGTYSSTTGLSINAVTGAITPSTSTAGNHTVTYTIPASAGCAAVTATASVTITALPTAIISYVGTPFCTSISTPQAVTLTGTGAYTGGTYSSTTGLSINAVTGAIAPSTSTAGNHTVTYTIPASAGCAAVTATASVTITALPTAIISYVGTPFCTSISTPQAVTLTGTGAYTGGTYSSTTGLSINAVTGAITPNTSTVGNYTVTYTIPASSGCSSVIATTPVSINPIVTPVINCGVPTMSSVQFNWAAVTGATDYDVMYSVNTDPPLLIGNIGNVLSYTVSGLSTGNSVTFTLTPVGNAATCFASGMQTCAANNCSPPTAAINYPSTSYCTSINTPQAITLTGTGAFNGGVFSAPSGLTINAANGTITPGTSAPGNYTVTYTIPAATGCPVVTATASVSIIAIPTAPVLTAIQPTCSVNTATAIITGVTGLTYSFDNGTYSAALIYPGLAAGSTHTVTAKNAAGCISLPATITMGMPLLTPAAPIAIAVQPTCLLATATITITGIPGLTYSFDNGPYTSTLIHNGLTPGTAHTITAQNAAGCISSPTSIILNLQPTTPTAPLLTPTHPSCVAATGSVAITAIPGLLYSFDNGTYSPALIYSGLAAGSTHTVTAQNLAGCVSPATAITLNAPLLTPAAPILVPTQPTCNTATGGIAINGIPGLTYSFDNGPYTAILIYSGLTAGTSHTVSAKTAAGCVSLSTTITLNAQPITPIAVATPNSRTVCSGNSTAIALSSISGTIFNWTVSQTGVSGGSAGSGNSITQILTAAGTSQGHAVYTITPFANGCTGLPITVGITVNPLPFASANPTAQTICSGDVANIHLSGDRSETSFNWTVVQTGVTGAISGNGNSIAQILTATGTTPGTVNYTITPERDGCFGNPIVATVTVKPTPQVTGLNVFNVCDGNFSNIPLAATVPGTAFTWTVVQNNAVGASNGNGNAINQLLNTTAAIPGAAIYTVTPEFSGCVGNPFVITVNVNPLPQPKLAGGIICVDQTTGTAKRTYILNATLSNSAYDFEWYLNGILIPAAIDNTYEATAAGTYSVIATNAATGCTSEEVFATVDAAFIADTLTTTVSEAFSENPSVAVILSNGTGPFLYQLDNGAYQDSNVFTGMSSGTHTVHVSDINGCTDLNNDVLIIDYPHFFTPNGDGYNDTWNIPALSDQLNSKIFIFDRYGKLLKEISPKGQGWDGIYNDHLLPSTDYWFSVDYLEASINKTFKAHFSLKR